MDGKGGLDAARTLSCDMNCPLLGSFCHLWIFGVQFPFTHNAPNSKQFFDDQTKLVEQVEEQGAILQRSIILRHKHRKWTNKREGAY